MNSCESRSCASPLFTPIFHGKHSIWSWRRLQSWPSGLSILRTKKGTNRAAVSRTGRSKSRIHSTNPTGFTGKGGGWRCPDSPEVGGQGLPVVLAHACIEMLGAANWALLMYAGLTHGAAHLLQKFGTPELQGLYMRNLFSGDLTGTMCLTEPGAGSDVGSLRTRAERQPDGTFKISGQKMFISSGMHDLTENIIHMVLARIDGAPKGTRGISIFLVPRLRLNESGELVDNDVACAGIEQKMGIHGSATCALNFGENGGCTGYLMGEENKGMQIMFEMMNEARLYTGMQGLAHASSAYLHALQYAKERVQGAPIEKMKDPDAPRVRIIEHPDVRRMLMFMKSSTEGLRALLYLTAYCVDRVRAAEEEEEKELFQGYVDLMIPICKSLGSDLGFRVCETAIQVYGGYGYSRDYPVEQFMRDCKIASLYEGTNGIQALDLVGRKLDRQAGTVAQERIKGRRRNPVQSQGELPPARSCPDLRRSAGKPDSAHEIFRTEEHHRRV